MKLTSRQLRIARGCALALAVAVTAVFGDNEPQPAEQQAVPVASVEPRASAVAEKPAQITLEKLNRTPPAADGVDLFASKSWYAPPPRVQAKPAPAPQPTAPPLPFRYVGQLEGKDGLVVFLARGSDLLSVKPGEQLDPNYRLETVTPERLTLVYLPLGERQTLAAGGK